MPARPATRSPFRALLAVLLSAVLVALAAPFAGAAATSATQVPAAPGGPNGAATASGFLFYKIPQGQPVCTGLGFNASEESSRFYSRDDCGFVVFTMSESVQQVTVELYGPDGNRFATPPVTARSNPNEYSIRIQPDDTWPAGRIRMLVLANGEPAGEAEFGHNQLGASVEAAGGTYAPGQEIPLTGSIYEVDSLPPLEPHQQRPVPAKFSLRVVDPTGEVVWSSAEPITANDDGTFSATIPGQATQDIRATAETDFEVVLAAEVFNATYTDPGTGEWAAEEAGEGAVVLRTPPDELLLENSFVSAVGWVKPGEDYPSRVFVRNLTDRAFNNVQVTVTAPLGSSFQDAIPSAGGGAADVTARTITWNVGTVPAAPEDGQTIRTLVIESKTSSLKAVPTLVWRDLSSTATLTADGGVRIRASSHGPKVIPPDEIYDTARYGDRPFPVVPVDYRDRKHWPESSGDKLAGKINSPNIEGSTFNLFQEMSLGQLFPNGTVPSAGIATRGFEYEHDFEFTQLQPNGTCHGVTTSGADAGTPLYPERISDGFYQLPGDTQYYGGDRFGSAVPGAVVGVGALMDIDSACGPTGKLVYDSAAISDPEIDYSDYDTDKDGVVDFFMVVFAGCGGNGASQLGAAAGCPDAVPYDNVWPHSSSLEFYYTDPDTGLNGYVSDDQLKNLEGKPLYYEDDSYSQMTTRKTEFPVFVRVGPYNVNPETSIENASVISHEYGHSLGLPDFYSLGSRETYGDWNLMATDKSQNMDVFSRQEMGWIVPEVLKPGTTRTVNGWSDSKEDTGTIKWQTRAGEPYTLRDGRDGPVRNAQSYVAKLPGRQLMDPAKFETGDTATPSHVWWSGSGNDFGCSPQGGHNLDVVVPGLGDLPAETQLTLEFKSMWDIEWDYDYGFVLTTTPNGEDYTSNESENGYTTPASNNPNGNACQLKYGNGITGSSGSYRGGNPQTDRVLGNYPPSVFLADEYDITELVGQEEGVVRFSYSTDAGLARPGWFIDDIKVTATHSDGTEEVLLETNLEDDHEGGPDSPYFYSGGCKDDTAVANQCTPGWNYIDSSAGSDADHAYYMELRDRSGFDEFGKEENDREPIDFAPGLSLAYTDEAHGYGNVGTSNPPAQTPLDSQPEPLSDTPVLADAAWTAAADDNRFSDAGKGHTDNYTNEEGEPWTFQYNCLTFDVLEMSGDDVGPSQSDGNLTGDVRFTMGNGCGKFDYGYLPPGGGGGTDPGNTAPKARAKVTPKVALKSRQFTFDARATTDAETPDDLDYSWTFGDDSGKTAGAVVRHKYAKAGVYKPTVTVTDPRGETDTATVKIYVNKRVQCSKPSVTRSGGWQSRVNGDAQKNHYCVNDRNRRTGGDSMELSFTGPRLDIGYGKGKNGRSATVIIDGRERGKKISFHSKSKKPEFGFERKFRHLGRGTHTVQLVVSPPEGGRRYAFMDSFTFPGRVR